MGDHKALHRRFDDEQVVEGFVMGTLNDADQEMFEEHFLTCDHCLDRLAEAERLQTALRGVAVEEGVRWQQQVGFVTALGALWRRNGVVRWVAALLCLGVIGGGWWQMDQDRSRLRSQLEQALSPPSKTFLMPLDVTRSGVGPQELALGEGRQWIVLTVPVSEEDAPFAGRLLDAEGTTVWHSDKLRPDRSQRLLVGLPSTGLTSSAYRLEVWPQGRPQEVQSFELSIRSIGN